MDFGLSELNVGRQSRERRCFPTMVAEQIGTNRKNSGIEIAGSPYNNAGDTEHND
jgi:hypothetical protein